MSGETALMLRVLKGGEFSVLVEKLEFFFREKKALFIYFSLCCSVLLCDISGYAVTSSASNHLIVQDQG